MTFLRGTWELCVKVNLNWRKTATCFRSKPYSEGKETLDRSLRTFVSTKLEGTWGDHRVRPPLGLPTEAPILIPTKAPVLSHGLQSIMKTCQALDTRWERAFWTRKPSGCPLHHTVLVLPTFFAVTHRRISVFVWASRLAEHGQDLERHFEMSDTIYKLPGIIHRPFYTISK